LKDYDAEKKGSCLQDLILLYLIRFCKGAFLLKWLPETLIIALTDKERFNRYSPRDAA
jgi:hypothetical protein